MTRLRTLVFRIALAVLAIGTAVMWLRHADPPPPAPADAKPPAAAGPVRTDTGFAFGRFGALSVIEPAGVPGEVVLYVSDQAGWDTRMAALAEPLAERGALVVGIDYARFAATVERDGAPCLYLSSDFEDLGRAVQSHYRLARFMPPLLAGVGAGATMAYAILVQQPPGTFAGALSLGFSPTVALDKPLCGAYALRSRPAATPHREALEPTAAPAPWIVLQSAAASDAGDAAAFVAAVPGARYVASSGAAVDYRLQPAWRAQYLAAFDALADAARRTDRSAAPADLADLPLVEVPAGGGTDDRMAVILTGDGGWAGLDREVADTLAGRGIPVVGLSTLKYFWSAKTPERTAQDLDRILTHYLQRWGKRSAIVIGYSMGADVLPFALNRLPEATRARIAYGAALAPGLNATFEFHVSDWMSDSDEGRPVAPEIDRLSVPLLCVAGEGDDDNACTRLDRQRFRVVTLPGNHHFGGDYERLTATILEGAAAH
ncbi:MAG TPA: AcvB/VirJ family lysyl-phosphatidylglycerol hydrolase [Dokdonella sp.]|uniref:virulence factor family protein n=1 Tax=Dokdonella sp. TaxID=2291710 RepID=UPI002CDD5879|nr:AcvB/VirJ family lysyl-phosphatidylglycerol hydrolase [Dokdonella sp.]HUD41307.1 AcvB/VirJ family lysyl-phosphatidylglycerol hydrolase [Dokdonella sp.]